MRGFLPSADAASSRDPTGFPLRGMRAYPDARAVPGPHDASMYWDHMDGWAWMMMLIWSLVWIGLVAVGVWAILQWARRDPHAQSPHPRTARDLLDERLAAGEIDLDEYQRRR